MQIRNSIAIQLVPLIVVKDLIWSISNNEKLFPLDFSISNFVAIVEDSFFPLIVFDYSTKNLAQIPLLGSCGIEYIITTEVEMRN